MDIALEHSDLKLILEAGWQLPCKIPWVKSWRENMSVYAGLCKDEVVLACAQVLEIETREFVIPPWESAVTDEGFDIPVAFKQLKGKLARVVTNHNSLVNTLGLMNGMASLLSVLPRLQDNDLCDTAIANAISIPFTWFFYEQ